LLGNALNAAMFKLMTTLNTSSISEEIATLCSDEHGIDRLGDTTFYPPLRIERGSKTALRDPICLVDDDPSVLRSVGRLLESAGFRVITFSEPRSFLEYVAENSVQLAILDIWMEQMTGMELLAHLCAKSPGTRVIFISGHEDLAAKATVMQAGALAFFIKPFDNDYFLNAVRCALGCSPSSMKGAVA
jgi:PleD family two-component response regulator